MAIEIVAVPAISYVAYRFLPEAVMIALPRQSVFNSNHRSLAKVFGLVIIAGLF